MIKNIWQWVVGAVLGIGGVLLFVFNRQSSKLAAAQAKVKLDQTSRKADKIDTQIKILQERQKNVKKKLKKTVEDVIILEKDKAKIEGVESAKTSKEIEDYWNNRNKD